jgi:hypothetical protein
MTVGLTQGGWTLGVCNMKIEALLKLCWNDCKGLEIKYFGLYSENC